MSEWKTWSLQSWNDHLLDHYFRVRDDAAAPVVTLLVTADELVRVTGDRDADAEDVRDAFIEATRAWLRRSKKSLLDDAIFYRDWPDPPIPAEKPSFVAHLLFTCIAASESSEDLADEASFVIRLRELTADQLPDTSLQLLPRLWESLAEWLQRSLGSHRRLILPDPGAFTRIGYTIKLAFPDRRDQRQLSDLLDSAGLSGYEPPVGRVLSLIAGERARFRRSFLSVFDEFRRLFDSPPASAVRLADHRFWAAIREASLRGRGHELSAATDVRFSLLGEEEDDRIALFAVADRPMHQDIATACELPVSYGMWRFGLIPQQSAALDSESLEQVVSAILAGSFRLPRVSNHIDQRLLPFVTGPHGLLELAERDQLDEVSIALVQRDIVDDFLRVTGNSGQAVRTSSYTGWVQIHNLHLQELPFAVLEGTALARTWILHEALPPIASRVVGGVRVDGGWLGVRELLPRVVAPGATRVVVKGAKEQTLTKTSAGGWTFPSEDFAGEYAILISGDGIDHRRTIRFHATPASEVYKTASDPEAWIVEGVGGTGTLSAPIPFGDEISDADCDQFWERAAFLGRDVGVFVDNENLATWKIVHFGGKTYGARGGAWGDGSAPSAQVTSANARRRWRKYLFECGADPSDTEFSDARRRLKAATSTYGHLPSLEVEQSVPDLVNPRLASPSEQAGRLSLIMAGRASVRSGIDMKEWLQLTQQLLGVEGAEQQFVTRAWMEAGLIDVASSSRWWHRAVFARVPSLVGFKVGEVFGATLSGLVLPKTIEDIRQAAKRLGILVEERQSVSSRVPSTIALRAEDRRALETLASASHVKLQWLDVARVASSEISRHDGTSPAPGHYERMTRWSRWSLTGRECPEVEVAHYMRRDRPDYWVAARSGRRVWFYDINLARAWAAALLGEPAIDVINDGFLEVHHAFLPLPLARTLSILGSGLSGPVDDSYQYVPGNRKLRDFVLEIVSRTFDPMRVPLLATEQTTG